MGVGTASATATMTADEIIVETALGGIRYCLPSFSKTINLATTGAGGMDTGTAPINGYVALYAIYNPTTGASALLARNATSAVQPNIYSGANMPSGYTASALVSVWQTNGSGQFLVGNQYDRTVADVGITALTTSTIQTSYTSFSISGAVPPNAKTCRGYMAISGNTSGAGLSSNLAGSSTGIGGVGQGGTIPANSASVVSSFPHIPLVTPQTLYYQANASAGTMTFIVGIYEYTF
ncbi:TPA: phage tail protein [Burkholderia cepacia]|nr:phage tail protein [Burkholderia territorii]HDR9497031.1 phage tail protein [Burkholderia cepacia]